MNMKYKLGKKEIFSTVPILIFSFILLFIIFSFINKDFYKIFNIVTMLRNASFVGILAVGMTLVLISGEVDLSIGGNIGLTSVIFAYTFTRGFDIWLCFILALSVGIVVGLLNSFLVAYLRMNSLITTLGTLAVTQGLAFTITNGLGIVVMEERLLKLTYGELWKIPIPVIILVISMIVMGLLLNLTKFGRIVKVIGGNRTVAYLCGLNVVKIKSICLFTNALIASFVGLLITANAASGMPQNGRNIEMEVLAVAILGGASLEGGEGSILGTAFSILILSVLYNGLTVANAPSEIINMMKGFVLLLIVGVYAARKVKTI